MKSINHLSNDKSIDLSKPKSQQINPFPKNSLVSMTQGKKKRLEKLVEKGENAGNLHFLLFPQCFLSHQITEAQYYQY